MPVYVAPGRKGILMSAIHDEHGPAAPGGNVAELVPTKPEAEVAADLKRRMEEALAPVCAIMDEAAAKGLQIQYDNIMYFGPPMMRYKVNGLRVVRVY